MFLSLLASRRGERTGKGSWGKFIHYPRVPEPSPARYLRVVRGWVDEMKRAVDEANR